MKHDDPNDLEKDALWEFLRQSPAQQARPSFAADVVRAARLSAPEKPWWQRALIPLSFGGLLAGAAAMVVVSLSMQQQKGPSVAPVAKVTVTSPGSITDVQDYAESQVLSVAADHLSDYSDDELVSLVGFNAN
jgi:hypothetical protein